jgi:PAS domain S-box-containing protein
MNFAHKLFLVQAEMHRARGEVLQAMKAYEQASQGAREHGYLSEAGLAHALAAEFFQDLGLRQAALHNAKQAAQAWRRWGAHALVESLNQRLPDLLEPSDLSWRSSNDPGKVHTTTTQPITPVELDTESIISASQMLSAETDFERLLTRLLDLVMANSGAEHAVLLVNRDNGWFVQARGDGTSERPEILPNQPFDAADPESVVPEPVFHYCRRTKDSLVVGDAQLDHRFTKNRTIQTHNIKSIACTPVFSGGTLNAMLYLDNRQMADVFTPERMKLIKHLSSQFGVSMENALLHDSLSQRFEELQEIQDRYQLAVAGSAAGIWDWDIRTNELYLSDRAIELFGYRPGEFEITMEDFWSRLHPDESPSVLRAVDRHLIDHVPYIIDCRLRTKSGEYRWFHARGQAIWDSSGEAVRMSGSITDITPRKQAEEKLKRSEERFRSLMEQSPLAIEILTPEGRITEVNAAWKRLWGLNEDEAALRIEKYNMLTDPQLERLGVQQLVERAFAGEPVILPVIRYSAAEAAEDVIEFRIGGMKSPWIQNHLYPVKDADGKTLYVVNTYMDITEVKRAERDAREQRDVLARMDRTTSMGQLTGSIAHELNQPLTGILSNAQAAQLMIDSGNWKGNEWKEIMTDIAADAKRAGDVIRNLRDLYREQKGVFLPVDINAVVAGTIQLLNSEFILQHVSVTTEHAASIPLVNGNKIQIQQVLVNLITNGIQAMQGLADENRRLHIATAHDSDEVKVWVGDRGPGIDPDNIDRVFEPLATWKPGGTGIGLAISNSIIQAHEGRMFAENKADGGAVVGFVLPVLRGGQ